MVMVRDIMCSRFSRLSEDNKFDYGRPFLHNPASYLRPLVWIEIFNI